MPTGDKSVSPPMSVAVIAAGLLTVTALAWAGNYVLGRAIAGQVPTGGLSVGRWLVATVVLLPFAWPHLMRDWSVLVAKWKLIVLLGLAGGATFGTLQYGGMQFTTATNGGLIGALSPLFIALAGSIMFGDRLSARQWLGLALSIAGALTIVAKGGFTNLTGLRVNIGDLMVVAAIVAWAFYSAMLRLKPPVHWTSFAVVTFAIAMLANIPLAIVEHIAGHGLQPTLMTAAAIVYAGIGSGVIGIAAWNIGVEMIGSQRAGGYLNLVPVFSVLLAAFVLGERLEMFHALAFALIAAGLWLAAFPARDGRAA